MPFPFPLQKTWSGFCSRYKEGMIKLFMAIVILGIVYNIAMFFLTGWASYYLIFTEKGWHVLVAMLPTLSMFGDKEKFAFFIAFWAMFYGVLKR